MHTMVQEVNNDYDIDDGVIFCKNDLIGIQGADKTALDTKKWFAMPLIITRLTNCQNS